ncbi:MnhB domain-containing protein [Helicovermis profundi]|uniref:Na+/H+ antiporter MnhB subunit-related protein domain-containing protein n=1 Tax=Helicovermis profundi TaxID=3065157 RepID=A0AAU9ENT3_9FIRM|nr:hypothetical protein HLPR_04510 [Clostridia bacterium S502]
MENSKILNTVSRILLPFIIIFGIYIIVNGDKSVGGGFQGGVILSTSYLVYYQITNKHLFSLKKMLKVDKYIFIILIFAIGFSLITKGELFTNFFPSYFDISIRRTYLELLNIIIGTKVAIGFIVLFLIFIEEGDS